jgi:hypothetical protein
VCKCRRSPCAAAAGVALAELAVTATVAAAAAAPAATAAAAAAAAVVAAHLVVLVDGAALCELEQVQVRQHADRLLGLHK